MQTLELTYKSVGADAPLDSYLEEAYEWLFDHVLPYEQYQTVTLSLDFAYFHKKPSRKEFGRVNYRIAKYDRQIMLSTLVTQIVQPYGRTWSAGTFNVKRTRGKKNSKSWIEQQIFAVDFDNKKGRVVSFEDVHDLCKEHGLDIAFADTTFSSIHQERFRVVFVLPFVVYHEQLRNAIQQMLLHFFPEADQSCSDAARLITGGKELIYEDLAARLDVDRLAVGVHSRWHQTNANHISRTIQQFSRDTGVSIVNGILDIQGELDQEIYNAPVDDVEGILELNPDKYNGPGEEHGEIEKVGGFQKLDPASAGSYTVEKCSKMANICYHIIYINIVANSRHYLRLKFNVQDSTTMMNAPSTSVQSKSSTKPSTKPPTTPHTIGGSPAFFKNPNFRKLERVCPVYQDFMAHGRKFSNPELFGIYTNLRLLNGGRKRFFNIIESSGHSYDLEKLKAMAYYIDHRDYKPMIYEHFADQWNPEYRTLYEAALPGYGEVRVTSSIPARRIDEVYQEIDEKVKHLLADPIPGIHGFRAVTGLGKTRILTEIEGGCIIAFPRHDLIQEVAELFRAKGRDPIVMPKFPLEDVSEKFRDEILSLWGIGSYSLAMMRIREAAANDSEPALQKYVLARDKVANARKGDIVLTTHQAVLREGVRSKVMIFDEDPISTALNIFTVPEVDLRKFSKQLKSRLPPIRGRNLLPRLDDSGNPIVFDSRTDDQKLFDVVQGALRQIFRNIPADGLPHNIESLVIERDARIAVETVVMESGVSSNVLGLLECSHVICTETKDGDRSYTGITKQTLPNDCCVVVLSATIDEWLYRQVFGYRVKSFHDSGPVAPANGGRVVQYHQRSFSRSAIRRMGNIEKFLTDRFSDAEYRITFKEFKDGFKGDLHFGAVAGIDDFKGKNGLVIGTPHLHPSVYLLYAALVSGPDYVYDTTMVKQRVDRDGRRFWFYTYKDETLKNIHLHLVESELVQAVGRSRHLRESATVYVLSSMAVPGAEYRNWTKGDLENFAGR